MEPIPPALQKEGRIYRLIKAVHWGASVAIAFYQTIFRKPLEHLEPGASTRIGAGNAQFFTQKLKNTTACAALDSPANSAQGP